MREVVALAITKLAFEGPIILKGFSAYICGDLAQLELKNQSLPLLFRPPDAKPAGIESWEVYMSMDDPAREALWKQMRRRKEQFLRAIRAADVTILPRVNVRERNFKCSSCLFYERCMNQDGETEEALAMANDLNLLHMTGFIHHVSDSSHAR